MGEGFTRRPGRSLAERSARAGIGDAGPALGRPIPDGKGAPAHCWVRLPDGEVVPGIVLGWRRGADGVWAGECVYGVPDGPDVVLVRAWVPSGEIRPA